MECSCSKLGISLKEYLSVLNDCTDIDISVPFSSYYVLKTHEGFHDGILSLLTNKKEIIFFDKDHPKKKKMNRPVLLQSLNYTDKHCDDCHRTNICLFKMKINHIYKDHKLSLWIVTQSQPTNLIDGTTYLIVRDQYDFHIRLVISNWSYLIPTNEFKSQKELSNILNELLPIDSMIKLYDPLLTKCHIDGQFTLRCDAPNTELILAERIKKCFILDKLDDLREHGNQSYIHGNLQLALDYYTFAINRIVTMAEISMSNDNECEMNLFRNAFQHDLSRLHSNRSACYLREGLYPGANLDSFVVVTGRFFNRTYDEFFLKCLHRLICSNIGLQRYEYLQNYFELLQNSSINFNLRMKYFEDFNNIQLCLTRLKEEYQNGKYDLKQMFNNQLIDQKTFFDIQLFHSDYKNNLYLKKRNNSVYAKCSIPSGSLLLVQQAFAFVKSDDNNDQRRLLNTIEKHLIMAPTIWEFNTIRVMPRIEQWFKNEIDVDEDDYESYPKDLPWGLLVKTQQENPFRSKLIVGWWPEASVFKRENDSKQKANCLWFICGKTIFVFNFISITKNDEIIIANNHKINSFLYENQQTFTFLLGNNNKTQLNEIFDQLKKTQIYFDK